MALWWLFGGYVFPVVVKPEIFTFSKFKFDLEGQLPPKTTGFLTKVFCTFGPKLMILAWKGDKVWFRQAQRRVNFDC